MGPPDSNETELLREQVVWLHKELERQRTGRKRAERFVDGLASLTLPDTLQTLRKNLLELFVRVVELDGAFLLEANVHDGCFYCLETTDDKFKDFSWPAGDSLIRALGGEVINSFNVAKHALWIRQAPELREGVGSALHFALQIEPAVILVGVHHQKSRFRAYHMQQCEVLSHFAAQAWNRVAATEREIRLRQAAEHAISTLESVQKELRVSKVAAERANQAKSIFLANMCHEIRTPLSAVISLSELVLQSQLKPEQRDLVSGSLDSAEHLLQILNDILDLSKIESGQLDLEYQVLNLGDLVNQVLAGVAVRAEEKGLELKLNLDEKMSLWRTGDPLRLKQVLFNLLGNAVKFTPRGCVTLRVKQERGDLVCFAVEDTGIGLSSEQQEMVFGAFVQAEQSISRKYGGTGLGLAICRQLVARFGGEIWVESQPGRGSTFYFTASLPAMAMPREDSNVRRSADTEPVRMLRILVAEDNRINQLVVCRQLELLGHATEVVENGFLALQRIQEGEWDLVLMDMQMPVMDGLEATRQVRGLKDPKLANVPIVAVTANALKGERERCLQAGMDAYLTKPLRQHELTKVLARLNY